MFASIPAGGLHELLPECPQVTLEGWTIRFNALPQCSVEVVVKPRIRGVPLPDLLPCGIVHSDLLGGVPDQPRRVQDVLQVPTQQLPQQQKGLVIVLCDHHQIDFSRETRYAFVDETHVVEGGLIETQIKHLLVPENLRERPVLHHLIVAHRVLKEARDHILMFLPTRVKYALEAFNKIKIDERGDELHAGITDDGHELCVMDHGVHFGSVVPGMDG